MKGQTHNNQDLHKWGSGSSDKQYGKTKFVARSKFSGSPAITKPPHDTRNFVIHGYDTLTTDILWSIVVNHLPLLKLEIEKLLKQSA